ncbi:hypothetical protein HBH68_137320 [Parastagonospora nodorum]|nr:hypothetical protein HBH52_172300 [Parastagonospora nodorum]KAH5194940.1 hypothetical protein HBH68_137320 [Parastagonospora nodorum]KAH5283719.1 hypothetical protein HBI72_010010 [Parastagonospora nodorum]KAH5700396.1 hypothetical protein HBI44_057470 [Parastagonospora nodorum]KAH6068772.1 hypothetical protein HBI66_141210 [Parastagonospora nodorum]
MVYPEQYVLNDFNSHAESRYQAQFSIMANSGLYTVESITYTNVNKQRHQADMLLIGRYYLNPGPPVWAHGNGHHIEYYMGQPTDMCEPVPENHISRIYYFTPFRLMGSTQGSSKSKRKRHTTFNFEAEVFETVVNFVLLLTGRLDHAHNPRGIDMTGNLQFACLAFEKNHNAEEAAKLAFQENRLSFQEHSGSQHTQRSSELALRGVRLSEACESSTAETTPTKLPRTVVNSTSFRVQARYGTQPASMKGQVLRFQSDVDVELAQVRAAHQEEMKNLQAQLTAQDNKTKAAKAKTVGSKKKLKAVKQENKELKDRSSAQETKSQNMIGKYGRLKDRYCRAKTMLRIKRERSDD